MSLGFAASGTQDSPVPLNPPRCNVSKRTPTKKRLQTACRCSSDRSPRHHNLRRQRHRKRQNPLRGPTEVDRTIDHVFIGAGIEIEVRLQIIQEVLETSSATTVHLKDKIAAPKGMFYC